MLIKSPLGLEHDLAEEVALHHLVLGLTCFGKAELGIDDDLEVSAAEHVPDRAELFKPGTGQNRRF